MHIIGLVAQYHDSACAIVKDGKVVAASEEERFNRVKHSQGFPELALRYCLEECGVDIEDVEYAGYYFKPAKRLYGVVTSSIANTKTMKGARKSWGFIKRSYTQFKMASAVEDILKENGFKGKLYNIEHHIAHAASSFFVSPFERAAILTADATGETSSTQLALGEDREIKILDEIRQPHSLGYLYAAVTQYLGFKRNSDEYKVMGLAAYGKPTYVDKFRKVIRLVPEGKFEVDTRYFTPPSPPAEIKKISKSFIKLFGPPRDKGEPIDERHADIAASLQYILEETLIHIARHLYSVTGTKNLCLAGGVALNCVANAKILEATEFENIFIQPAANDPGCAIGTAMYIQHSILGRPREYVMVDPYLGPKFSNEQIEDALRSEGVEYERCENIERRAAELIAEGNIVGWFQGRMEWGPRALGNRSILADARRADMKDIVNRRIKMREPFRPFAPAVLREHVDEFFEFSGDSPFMLLAVRVKPDKAKLIPSVVHVDNTARIQTVSEKNNQRFYKLIKHFKEITGVPVVLNTSFNVQGEPIVCTPVDGVRCFKNAGLDYLCIGDYLVWKKK